MVRVKHKFTQTNFPNGEADKKAEHDELKDNVHVNGAGKRKPRQSVSVGHSDSSSTYSESGDSDSDSESSSSSSSMAGELEKSVTLQRLNVFDGSNFEEWCVRIRWGLIEKGLESLIKESAEEKAFREAPVNERDEDKKFKKFRKRNGKAVNYLINRLSSRVMMRVKNCITARQMYETLEALYKVSSDVGRDAARMALFSLKFRESGNMRVYIEKFERAADNYRTMGGELSPQEELEQFRTSLPGSYASVRDWFSLLRKEEKTLEMLKRKCLENYEYTKRDDQEQEKRIAGHTHYSKSNNGGNGGKPDWSNRPDRRECFTCGQIGHINRNCPNKQSQGVQDRDEKHLIKEDEKIVPKEMVEKNPKSEVRQPNSDRFCNNGKKVPFLF